MSFLGKLRGRLGFAAQHQPMKTPEDIERFKSQAWTSSKAADTYSRHVEQIFFELVTGPLFAEQLPNASRVLDVGAGTGRLSLHLAARGHEVTAADISAAMLEHIKLQPNRDRIRTLTCSGDQIPLPDGSMDAVVSMDFMVHFANWEKFLQEQARICRPGGLVVFNFLSQDNKAMLEQASSERNLSGEVYQVTHFAPFANTEGLRSAASGCGLELVSVNPYNFFGENALFNLALDRKEMTEFQLLFTEALSSPVTRRFVEHFERHVMRKMPNWASLFTLVTMRKVAP
jgi:2-polyprenyl-3-methyl-5-hydroxy-6-metoxy-1,4-benzoquinol methylase